jgi:hypothetical protein
MTSFVARERRTATASVGKGVGATALYVGHTDLRGNAPITARARYPAGALHRSLRERPRGLAAAQEKDLGYTRSGRYGARRPARRLVASRAGVGKSIVRARGDVESSTPLGAIRGALCRSAPMHARAARAPTDNAVALTLFPTDALAVTHLRLCHIPPNVSHASGLPDSNPRLNHSMRCADVPCVNDSGRTMPVVSR